jgi:hypothetical protein
MSIFYFLKISFKIFFIQAIIKHLLSQICHSSFDCELERQELSFEEKQEDFSFISSFFGLQQEVFFSEQQEVFSSLFQFNKEIISSISNTFHALTTFSSITSPGVHIT